MRLPDVKGDRLVEAVQKGLEVGQLLTFGPDRQVQREVVLFDGEKPRARRVRLLEVPRCPIELCEVAKVPGHEPMVRPERAFRQPEGPSEHLFRPLIVAAVAIENAEALDDRNQLGVGGAQLLFFDGQGSPVSLLRERVVPRLLGDDPEVRQRVRQSWVFGPVQLFQHPQRATVELLRAWIVILPPIHQAHVVERGRERVVDGTERLFPDLEGASISRKSGGVIAPTVADLAKMLQIHGNQRVIGAEHPLRDRQRTEAAFLGRYVVVREERRGCQAAERFGSREAFGTGGLLSSLPRLPVQLFGAREVAQHELCAGDAIGEITEDDVVGAVRFRGDIERAVRGGWSLLHVRRAVMQVGERPE